MKTLYIECNMGAAGDMLMAALCELLPEPDAFIDRMNGLGLPGVRLSREPAQKCGINGTRVAVSVHGHEELEPGHEHGHEHEHEHAHEHDHEHGHDHAHGHEHDHGHDHEHAHEHDHGHEHEHDHDHEHGHEHEHEHAHEHDHEHGHEHDHGHGHHHHSSLADVRAIIGGLDLPEQVKRDAAAVYARIAKAESEVHGTAVEQIHFHEVGALDAVADITGVCLLMELLKPERVVVSPIHVGCGLVRCAHGTLPVPAPATARILEGVPIYGGDVRGELCTPTGAALLKHFADDFGGLPAMRVQRVGYGMGTRDFEWANCVRALLGESDDAANDGVVELRCNLDDMTGEEIGFALEALMDAGALDAWAAPILMKKGRPATMLCCLCRPADERKFAELMLKHTTTLGVRCQALRRYALDREPVALETPWGAVRGKRSSGFGVERVKPEYDDLADIARREGIPISDIRVGRAGGEERAQ